MAKSNLKEHIEKDIKYTSSNYANMYTRLKFRDLCSRFLIVYYSIVAIINTVIPLFFKDISQIRLNLLNFSSLIVSIILLVASMAVSLARYSDRCNKVMVGIDKLKFMKKDMNGEEINITKYKELIKKYHRVIDNIELRTDYDYYLTCKSFNEEKKKFTISKIIFFKFQNFMEKLIIVVLIIGPLLFYIWCFII